MLKKILLLSLLCFAVNVSAQKMMIKGNVYDTTNNINAPLPNALAMLIRIKDSVLIDFKRTDANGNFEFKNLTIDTFQLLVSHPRLGENSYYLFGSQENHEFDIKRIIIPPKSQNLKEVVIFAYKDPIYYKGDTLVYVADSFKTNPNAVVEDLLKKLPGITVNKDGSLEAQGKDIQQVLVDGDEFFGADPTMATRNLGAQGVETVEIYEKKDENSTDDSETIQVLDLRLKDSAKKGYFGKISGASDFAATNGKPFYEGEILANKFNKTRKISVFGLASNTMKSSLEWRDMYKYGIAQRNFYNEEDDSWNWNVSSGSGEGIPQTIKTGVYYNDKINKKTELNVNYTYSNNSLKTKQINRSQYFLADTSYVTDLVNDGDKKNEAHEFNLKLEMKLDSLTTLEIEPKATLNKASTLETDSTNFLSEDYILQRSTIVTNNNDAEGINFSGRLALRRDFKKKGRKLTSNYRYWQEDNKSSGNLTILDTGLIAPGYLNQSDQLKENAAFSRSNQANISYIEPLGKMFKIEFDYELYRNFNDQEKITTEFQNGSYSLRNDTLSNSFKTTKEQHRFGSQLIFEYKKHRFSTGLRYRNIDIDNVNFILQDTITQDIENFLPRARYVYKISQHNRFVLNYSTSSDQPDINQLQPVFDNTNPNRIQEGNPDLKPNYVHRFSASYNVYKPLSGAYMWSSMNHSITQDGFANETTFDQFGIMRSKTINVDGLESSSFNVGGGFPIFKRFLEVKPSLNMSRFKGINIVNTVQNITSTNNIGGGLEFTIEKDSVEFSIGGNYNYSKPSSTISSQSILPFSSQSLDASFEWTLPKGFFFETDVSYTVNSQRAEGYDVDFLIWNASLAKAFLKNQNLLATVHVYDILNQNIMANRFVNANVITDTKSVIIARYVMFRLTYKFNSTNTIEPNDFF